MSELTYEVTPEVTPDSVSDSVSHNLQSIVHYGNVEEEDLNFDHQ